MKINDILKIGSTVFVIQTNDIANLKNMPVINKRLGNVGGAVQANAVGLVNQGASSGGLQNYQMNQEEEKSSAYQI